MHDHPIRRTLDIHGQVQGLGVRPAIFRAAVAAGLGGTVQNCSGSVRLEVEGPEEAVRRFISELPSVLPRGARVDRVVERAPVDLAPGGVAPFRILSSRDAGSFELVIPPDLAMCDDCRRDVLDPANRRYGYAFTTCTLCGPRYTVIHDTPYDRARTTLSVFPLCSECQAEYESPGNRRFHAESMACSRCGPRLRYLDASGAERSGNPTRLARRALADGAIGAVRGLGGFLLVADARNRAALIRLRERKARPHKPFAVMVPDVATAGTWCEVSECALELLTAPESPIVVLDVKSGAVGDSALPMDLLSPDTRTLGLMLPTTPLQLLLAHPLEGDPVPLFDVLVMTSGNRRGEPICLTEAEAVDRLSGIADFFLVHDREINLRNDDSVCVVREHRPQVWRRARGFAPQPLVLDRPLAGVVLGMGADMKNTVALGFGSRLVVSPHVGDLDTPQALEGFETVVRTLPRFLETRPTRVAVDLHEGMESARTGRRFAAEWGVPVVEVQHHHAHAAACLAEHGEPEGLVLVFDGTGLGPDGSIWGAELLELRGGECRRLASFAGVPLPGGECAIREPMRQLVGRWVAAGVEVTPERAKAKGLSPEQVDAWVLQSRRGANAPRVHSAGRLFDSFSAALGLAPAVITYEGQPAIRLESAARRCPGRAVQDLPFTLRGEAGTLWVDWADSFRLLASVPDLVGHEGEWALAVHRAVAKAAVAMVRHGLDSSPCRVVGLSGGCFMNAILTDLVCTALRESGIRVLLHHQLPPGDGCISAGQVVIAGG
jgi:hydrogenase maturation protein HypF